MTKKRNQLFKDISISNDVSRNGFDLSNSVTFSSKAGELLPILHRTLMYGDSIEITPQAFTRTEPVQTAAFTRINEYFDFFFVPYRLLGKQIPHILVQDKDNPSVARNAYSNNSIGLTLPSISLNQLRLADTNGKYVQSSLNNYSNEFGFNRSVLSQKLLNYLGYSYLTDSEVEEVSNFEDSFRPFAFNLSVSLLPLAAYQKVYYDYYRNTQWEDNVPYNYNFDYINSGANFIVPDVSQSSYWNNPTMFDLRYANYPKDLFFGLLPDSQYGDTSVVPVNIDNEDTEFANIISPSSPQSTNVLVGADNGRAEYTIKGETNNLVPNNVLLADLSEYTSTLKGEFSILEWRKANMVQKMREIIGSGRKDYKSIVQKIFNVDIPDTLSDMCMYLGGTSNVINISEVVNNNLADENQANIQGKGTGNAQGDTIRFTAQEPGVLLCIYHIMPEIDFSLNALHFDVTKTNVDDFANPIFDKLGFQEFPVYYLDNSKALNEDELSPYTLGYTTRYFDYKTSIDVVLGRFREDYYHWVAPINKSFLKNYQDNTTGGPNIELTANFFKINPKVLDTIFVRSSDTYVTSDQFLTKVNFNFHAVRNLDYIGLPY